MENLFDDRDDPKNNDPLDAWFAEKPEALNLKLKLLTDTMLALNDGKGPDILALVEVENLRAVQLLQASLNARLSAEWQYKNVIHVDNISGRRIEPAIITRLPVDPRGTQRIGDRRLLMARLVVDKTPLTVIVGHWTSRVTDKTGSKRLAYAREMYDAYLDLEKSSSEPAEVILSGDFNDEPDDESVRLGLRASGERSTVIDLSLDGTASPLQPDGRERP